MDADQIMQMAADHAARAEELDVTGAMVTSRHHVEFAKMYVSMAKEVRLGTTDKRRSQNYRNVMFKPVIIQPAPDPTLAAGADEDDDVIDVVEPEAQGPGGTTGAAAAGFDQNQQ